MSPTFQTYAALAVVVIALVLMVRSSWKKRRKPGCRCGDACSAVTPEIKKLQARLKP